MREEVRGEITEVIAVMRRYGFGLIERVLRTGATGLEPAASGVTGRRQGLIFGGSGTKWHG